ncbi:hypothetical protein A2482_03735 [Candidatus Falkowbacteria bacterium RIFOXYC2_FULL_48_21]|uniref:EF-hand domain-containing protein n=1 Tax=Candidatus Falkowbacteria bacterium RIFOXYC2_FULL_48_21 TaxID=1798005 RepID=A0A1F5TFX4_9BACT|nr:MAG: hypothetical protein A2482_03735 [Candidatus Falkowbacteria bacterium RIFOXYC2_FULL_48_21]
MKKSLLVLTVFLVLIAFTPPVKADNLPQKLKGKILLQVENKGAAWYVNPADVKRYSMGKPDEAFSLMRQLGVGISNANLIKIPVANANFDGPDSDGDGLSDAIEESIGSDKNKVDTDGDGYQDKDEFLNGYRPVFKGGDKSIDIDFAKKQYGKIFIQVESKGEAWYVNPADGKRYFLRRPDDAFSIMKKLGLGISNNDLKKISVKNSALPDTKKQTTLPQGAAKIQFINVVTGKAVPGHTIYCSGCSDVSMQNQAESDINGEVTLKPVSNATATVGKVRTDWHNYDTITNIKLGETRKITMTPQAIGSGDEIYFPETTYTNNAKNKTQLHIVYKDMNGKPIAKRFVYATGPIDINRVNVNGLTDTNGKTIIDLPINGAYRISISDEVGATTIQRFFQIEAPTGYNVQLDLDFSKLDQMISGTKSLSKSYQEGGMILICVREKGTNKPMYSSILIPYTNTIITATTKHDNDICVPVPKSYETVGVPANGLHKGHPDVSTSGADKDGILYLYVTAND